MRGFDHAIDCKTVRIFGYSTREQSNKRSATRLKTESEVLSLSPHKPYGRVRFARFACVRFLRHALPIFLNWFWEKTRLFCSLITQRFLFLVSTVSPKNAWHNHPHLCTDYESRCLRMQARLINYKHKSTHGVSFLKINFSELFQLKLFA